MSIYPKDAYIGNPVRTVAHACPVCGEKECHCHTKGLCAAVVDDANDTVTLYGNVLHENYHVADNIPHVTLPFGGSPAPAPVQPTYVYKMCSKVVTLEEVTRTIMITEHEADTTDCYVAAYAYNRFIRNDNPGEEDLYDYSVTLATAPDGKKYLELVFKEDLVDLPPITIDYQIKERVE